MARKDTFVTIAEDGRDKGKVFKIIEAPAIQTDKWITRAQLALNRDGVKIPDQIMNLGLIGMIVGGIHKLAGVRWEDLEPLLDEMMSCVWYVPTPSRPDVIRKPLVEEIEEISTYAILRKEVFQLHVGFFNPADRSMSQPSAGSENETS